MPVNTKALVKKRWKARKPSSKGPATSKVPAASTPQDPPASEPDAKEASPTVSTW